jgi:hypothetical protein
MLLHLFQALQQYLEGKPYGNIQTAVKEHCTCFCEDWAEKLILW